MIVEDEPPSMRRIARMIEESGMGFEVVATAGDGEQALERLERTPCDVVFTDIRMPVMDGLQLMDAIRERLPACLIVVISGYQEYAYFSRALRAKASDYLLKPLSKQEMDSLLCRLRGLHEQRQRELLSRRLAAEINRSELPSRPEQAAAAPPQKLAVCLFCAGAIPYSEDAEMYPGAAAWRHASPEEALRETVPGHGGFAWMFMGNTPVERILVFDMPARLAGGTDALIGELHGRMAQKTEIPISCAYTPAGVALHRVGSAIKALRARLAQSVQIGKGSCVPLREGAPADPPPRDAALAEGLARAFESGGLSPQLPLWQELMARIEGESWTQRRAEQLLMDALAKLEARHPDASADIGQARRHILEVIGTALSLQDLSAGLENLGEPIPGAFGKPSVAQRGVAEAVERYLRAHFAEHISIQMLGTVFGYVPSYVSLLFRKAYGVSPADYLTRIRLDEAKRLMQRSPDMLIREIAESVGFKSQHHFSRVFKKNEGVWPTKYVE